jgi:hypothetical protein
MILRDPPAAEQSGVALVPRLGVDLHGGTLTPRAKAVEDVEVVRVIEDDRTWITSTTSTPSTTSALQSEKP